MPPAQRRNHNAVLLKFAHYLADLAGHARAGGEAAEFTLARAADTLKEQRDSLNKILQRTLLPNGMVLAEGTRRGTGRTVWYRVTDDGLRSLAAHVDGILAEPTKGYEAALRQLHLLSPDAEGEELSVDERREFLDAIWDEIDEDLPEGSPPYTPRTGPPVDRETLVGWGWLEEALQQILEGDTARGGEYLAVGLAWTIRAAQNAQERGAGTQLAFCSDRLRATFDRLRRLAVADAVDRDAVPKRVAALAEALESLEERALAHPEHAARIAARPLPEPLLDAMREAGRACVLGARVQVARRQPLVLFTVLWPDDDCRGLGEEIAAAWTRASPGDSVVRVDVNEPWPAMSDRPMVVCVVLPPEKVRRAGNLFARVRAAWAHAPRLLALTSHEDDDVPSLPDDFQFLRAKEPSELRATLPYMANWARVRFYRSNVGPLYFPDDVEAPSAVGVTRRDLANIESHRLLELSRRLSHVLRAQPTYSDLSPAAVRAIAALCTWRSAEGKNVATRLLAHAFDNHHGRWVKQARALAQDVLGETAVPLRIPEQELARKSDLVQRFREGTLTPDWPRNPRELSIDAMVRELDGFAVRLPGVCDRPAAPEGARPPTPHAPVSTLTADSEARLGQWSRHEPDVTRLVTEIVRRALEKGLFIETRCALASDGRRARRLQRLGGLLLRTEDSATVEDRQCFFLFCGLAQEAVAGTPEGPPRLGVHRPGQRSAALSIAYARREGSRPGVAAA